MINSKLREYLCELSDDCILFDNPSFDDSIVGISTDGSVVYDLHMMVDELAQDENMSFDDVYEFIDYNTLRALSYTTGNIPVIIDTETIKMFREEEDD